MSSVNLVLKTSDLQTTTIITTSANTNNYATGLKWESYNGYHNENVNYSNTVSTLPYSGTSDNLQNLQTGTNNNFSEYRGANTNPNAKQEDHFTIEWLGYLLCNETGTWTFTTNSDDGSYFWVDNDNTNFASSGYTAQNSTVNNGGMQAGTTFVSGSVNLTANKYYFIRILFGEFEGGQTFTLKITKPNGVSNNGVGLLFNKVIVSNSTVITNSYKLLWPVNLESLLCHMYNEYDKFQICLQYVAGNINIQRPQNLNILLSGLPFTLEYKYNSNNRSTITLANIKIDTETFYQQYSLLQYHTFTSQAIANILINITNMDNDIINETFFNSLVFSFNIIGDPNCKKKISRLL